MRVPYGSSHRQGQQREIRAFSRSRRTNFHERAMGFRGARVETSKRLGTRTYPLGSEPQWYIIRQVTGGCYF
jgi:hypothetical protein